VREEGLEVALEADLPPDRIHFAVDARHLLQPQLVDLGRRQVGGGVEGEPFGIIGVGAGEAPHAVALGRAGLLRGQEGGRAGIGGLDHVDERCAAFRDQRVEHGPLQTTVVEIGAHRQDQHQAPGGLGTVGSGGSRAVDQREVRRTRTRMDVERVGEVHSRPSRP
jgi:hypothetical protein